MYDMYLFMSYCNHNSGRGITDHIHLTSISLDAEEETMPKTDDVLVELKMVFNAFLKSFFPFAFENETYRLVDNYVANPWIRCDICRNYPIQDVSVIISSRGKELHVGNECIDQLTNRKASEWFKKYRTKRENVTNNRKYIDDLDSILTAFRKGELPFNIKKNDVELLLIALERMCNGFTLTSEQQQLIEFYINKSAFI